MTSPDDHVTRCVTILQDVMGLVPISDQQDNPKDKNSLNQLNGLWEGESLLHMAAYSGHPDLVSLLLLYGADPSLKNQSGHTPYLVSRDKATRNSFRRFMAQYPAAYDYDSTHIPSPLTEEMEKGRSQKEAERKKEKKRAKKQRDKVCYREAAPYGLGHVSPDR